MKHFYSTIAILIFAWLFWASSPKPVEEISVTYNQYEDISRKTEKDTLVKYIQPIITPTVETKQILQKGEISISCEVSPFKITRNIEESSRPWWADPSKPGYDVIQLQKTPTYNVSPERVSFKLRISNNSTHVLKLIDCAIFIMIDGKTYDVPKESLTEWTHTMVVKNTEWEYVLPGPLIASVGNPKSIYILVNDAPTQINEAGITTKRENFEWYFNFSSELVTKSEKITYEYLTTPIKREVCHRCNSTGKLSAAETCHTCKGAGSNKNIYDGKSYTCSTCSGTGKETNVFTCTNCAGMGQLSYPASKTPEIINSENYSGWRVDVISKPQGANVRAVNTLTGKYESSGLTNKNIMWYNSQSESTPIIVEYNGIEVKVMPLDKKNRPISKVVVDFRSGKAKVKKGTLVE